MYKVFLDDTLMCDSRIEELALINPVAKLEENKAGSFSFVLPPGHPHYDSINKRKSIISVYIDEEAEPTFSGMCIEVKKDFYNQKTIYCEGELSFLNDSIQRPKRYSGYTVRGLLEAYIESHNAQVEESKRFTVGIVTVQDSNDYISCYTNMESTMKAIKEDLVDDLGGIIRIRHEGGVRYIDYLAESPNTNSQAIRLGENLLDFTSNIDSTDIATAIIPLGAKLEKSKVEGLETRLTISGRQDYVYNQEAVDTYGWIYKTVTFDDVTTPEALKRKGEQYLTETQFENVVIEAKVADLHFADKDVERFKISDQCRVESAPHGMNKAFRLTKQTLNLNNPEKDKFTLGKSEKTTLSAKSNQASEEVKKVVESIVPPNHILNQAVANATALITSAMGGYVVKNNNEFLIMDTDSIETAKNVWRWNINGLGYSSTGYEGPYIIAITMDGKILADAITVEGLEVGKNVKMGENAVISWGQVTDTDNVATVEQIPTKTSELQNDSDYATTGQIPTNTNQLENGAGYTTMGAVEEKGYTTMSDVEGKNYTTMTDVEGKGYTTMNEVANQGYQNASQVTQITKDTVTTQFVNALRVESESVNSTNGTDRFSVKAGYAQFFRNEEPYGGIGANTLQTAGNTYKTSTFRGYVDMIVFSQDGTPYYVINPGNNPLTDAKYTENHYFRGSARFTNGLVADGLLQGGYIIATDALSLSKMAIGGGEAQEVEWVWNGEMARWVLCSK